MSEIKPSTRRFLDDEDDMMSEEEMRRIDRILKSSQNKWEIISSYKEIKFSIDT